MTISIELPTEFVDGVPRPHALVARRTEGVEIVDRGPTTFALRYIVTRFEIKGIDDVPAPRDVAFCVENSAVSLYPHLSP